MTHETAVERAISALENRILLVDKDLVNARSASSNGLVPLLEEAQRNDQTAVLKLREIIDHALLSPGPR